MKYAVWAFDGQGSAIRLGENVFMKQDTLIPGAKRDSSIKWWKSSGQWVVTGDVVLEKGHKEEVTLELDAEFFLLALPKPMHSASLGEKFSVGSQDQHWGPTDMNWILFANPSFSCCRPVIFQPFQPVCPAIPDQSGAPTSFPLDCQIKKWQQPT